MSFPRYPEYKDSGVEWLGEVPAHWTVCALRRIVNMQSGESITGETIDETGDFPVYGGNGLRGYTTDFTHDGHYALIGRQGALCGNVNYASGKFWASEHAVVVTPVKQVATVWLGELLRVMNLNQYSVAAAQPGLSVDLVGRLGICVPPLPEQTQIAAFLDRETAKIDTLVAEQRRLMELLKEKRQAVISHAVTRGLNPDAPMKPSGIEWLGDVPAHWATPAMYMRYSSELGKMLDSAKITGQHLIPYMRNVDVQWGMINFVDLPEMDIPVGEYERYIVKSGDLLVCEGGEVGRAAIVPPITGIFGYQKALHRLRALDTSEDSRFMYFTLLWAANTGIFDQSGSSTIAHLTGEQLRKYRFPKPPASEQKAIAQYLEAESAKFDTLTTEAQRAIDLLQERRTALISAAVTGQIDVRGEFQGAVT